MKKEAKSNYRKILLISFVIIVAIIGSITFYEQIQYWIDGNTEIEIPIEDVMATIENAEVITFNGDYHDITADIHIEADGTFVGTMHEAGLINSTFTYRANDTDLMYIEGTSDRFLENSAGYTFKAYNMDETLLGYSEENLDIIYDDIKEYGVFFFEESLEYEPYILMHEQGQIISNEGEVLYTITCDYDRANGIYEIRFTSNTEVKIPYYDILMAYYHTFLNYDFNNVL